MNILFPIIAIVPLFYLAYRVYGSYISKIFDENNNNPTPANTFNDGVDYCPTKPLVLFGHHFASIAGGGPIIGPTIGLIFGYVPVWLWIVLGSIFIGAVHDFSVLFASVREKGKSIAEIARDTMGKWGFVLFISFTILMLLLVTSSFLKLTATALTSLVPLNILGLPENQTLLRMVGGKAQIGGIASTSVIVITLCAPFVGYLVYKRGFNPNLAALLAIFICIFSVIIGMSYPVSFKPELWMVILSFYTLFAAGIPVWLILQPRDFTNSFLLYGGIITLFLGSIACGIKGVKFCAPAFNIAEGTKCSGPLWPMLFITVACGAISGFHSLVAGGTTSKQLLKESHAKKIAYGGMLLEACLAVGVLAAVGSFDFKNYFNIVFPPDSALKSNPILAFSLGMGNLLNKGFSFPAYIGTVFGILLVEGFVVTTLDTAVRLNRYLFEELWNVIFKKPARILKTYIFNSALCVILMFVLAYYNTFLSIWPVFGSANQLLAALALLAVSLWLITKGKKFLFAFIPAIFMMATAIYSLAYLLFKNHLPTKNYILVTADILLIIFSAGVILLAGKKMKVVRKENC